MSREDEESGDAERQRPMTEEERQSTMDFILRQQARFAADMQQLREAQAQADGRWEQRWERAEKRWDNMDEGIRSLLVLAEIHNQEIKELAKIQAESQARTDRQMAETDERLNALVNVVERMISEKRGGESG
jgi:hypothetical protein